MPLSSQWQSQEVRKGNGRKLKEKKDLKMPKQDFVVLFQRIICATVCPSSNLTAA